MNEMRTEGIGCEHPADLVQSGIYSRGVYVPPLCLVCGEHLHSDVEIIVSSDVSN